MTDIVERLRHCSENCRDEYLHELSGRAADTITALCARVEKLEGALRDIGQLDDVTTRVYKDRVVWCHQKHALTALGDTHE